MCSDDTSVEGNWDIEGRKIYSFTLLQIPVHGEV